MGMSHVELVDDAGDVLHSCSNVVSYGCFVPRPGKDARNAWKREDLGHCSMICSSFCCKNSVPHHLIHGRLVELTDRERQCLTRVHGVRKSVLVSRCWAMPAESTLPCAWSKQNSASCSVAHVNLYHLQQYPHPSSLHARPQPHAERFLGSVSMMLWFDRFRFREHVILACACVASRAHSVASSRHVCGVRPHRGLQHALLLPVAPGTHESEVSHHFL